MDNIKWNEGMIGRELALNYFQRRHLVVVPNCGWTGYECDLLVVTKNLRIIDVEIKISRSDLRADVKKDKWWKTYAMDPVAGFHRRLDEPEPKTWPEKVWKHYYAAPLEIWDESLTEKIPAASGILLLYRGHHGEVRYECRRPARPNPDAEKLSPESAVDIARLASLRMWNAYQSLQNERARAT
ncbi:hypothetical protein [Nitrosovibrio sp. Nv4]|uniref:hypothetical protein n=1 Tax=Nitrosovibrio sp. Nv4 TaxID=1945880 RepID=UPI000BD076B4|nr:hypothetical protein [Nitrosovibrio sp. Nv4]SOD42429.1 hypothetical protein SAMN06298226_2768 [Nitrosovibrio sp. Nv4]